MFEISFKDFRAFHRQGYISVKPITILIGENSAGKSSFIAGLKYMLDFISRMVEPNFNDETFQLGTFDQIAHFRRGRGGRARDFSISLRQSVRMGKASEQTSKRLYLVDVVLHFASVDSHAAVQSVTISSEGESLVASLVNRGLSLEFIDKKNNHHSIGDPKSMPSFGRSDFSRYWQFILADLNFRISRRRVTGDDELFHENAESIDQLLELIEALTQRLSIKNEATSAIRTKPQRTYTPGTEKKDSEGSHVPYEIAKIYRSRGRNRDAWNNVQKGIEQFGQMSEMFKEISVKSFGKTASDPFQIQFSFDGPKTNLVDLGYGTSQVLPIIYSIAISARKSRFLIQQPEVHLHPKAQASLGQYIVDSWKNKRTQFILETHSDYIVDRIRLAIGQGVISRDDVSLLFFERKKLESSITPIELDPGGDPIDPPEKYRAFFIDEQMKLLCV